MKEWVSKMALKGLDTAEVTADRILFIPKNDSFNGKVLEVGGGGRLL